MNRRTPLARFGLLTLAALQLLITGAAAWADARLDAGGPKGPIHLEAHSTQACAQVHPADCILHRFLSTPSGVVRPISAGFGLSVGQASTLAGREQRRSDLEERLPDIRGPPLS
jgi:hypothetical protein